MQKHNIPQEPPKWIWGYLGRMWEPPKIRQNWNDDQEPIHDRYQLFFNLVVVALAINLTNLIKDDLTGRGIGNLIAYYLVFFNVWLQMALFNTRFIAACGYSKIVRFFYALCIVGMSGSVLHTDDVRLQFSLNLMASRIFLSLLYLQVWALTPTARDFATIALLGNGVAIVLLLASGFLPPSASKVIWSSLWIVDLCWSRLTYISKAQSLPVNVEHLSERFHEIVVLMVGESVISLLFDAKIVSVGDYGVIFFGFLLLNALKTLYSEAQPSDPDCHAFRRSFMTGRVFLYSHVFLGTALLCVGAGLGLFLKLSPGERIGRSEYWLLSVAVFLVLIFINVIRVSHTFKVRKNFVWFLRALVLLLVFILPTMAPDISAAAAVCVLSLLCVSLAVFDVFLVEVSSKAREDVVLFVVDVNKKELPEKIVEETPEMKEAQIFDTATSKASLSESHKFDTVDV